MSEELENQLAEAERRRKVAEQMRNETPSLQEKLKAITEELEAQKQINEKAEAIVDILVLRSHEITEAEIHHYNKLREILPRVIAEVKP